MSRVASNLFHRYLNCKLIPVENNYSMEDVIMLIAVRFQQRFVITQPNNQESEEWVWNTRSITKFDLRLNKFWLNILLIQLTCLRENDNCSDKLVIYVSHYGCAFQLDTWRYSLSSLNVGDGCRYAIRYIYVIALMSHTNVPVSIVHD